MEYQTMIMCCLLVCLQQWYTSTMNLLGTWLTDRVDLQLHLYQLKILIRVVKVRASSFNIYKSYKMRSKCIVMNIFKIK